MSQHYVDPNRVFVTEVRESNVKRIMKLLQEQGQIVPILVEPTADAEYDWQIMTNAEDPDPYAEARVMAVRRLGWETILVDDEDVTSG